MKLYDQNCHVCCRWCLASELNMDNVTPAVTHSKVGSINPRMKEEKEKEEEEKD